MSERGGSLEGLELVRFVSELLNQRRFGEAEETLRTAHARAVQEMDVQAQELILGELIELYCVSEPKQLPDAVRLSLEREALRLDAASRLQTAMLFFYSLHDYERALQKATETADLGRVQGDYVATYASLSLSGLPLLNLGRESEGLKILDEIERIVSEKRRFVVGDETAFLESLSKRQLAPDRIAKLASVLAPLCRNQLFRKKLEALAIGR